MKAFEIWINGEKKCVVGENATAIVSATSELEIYVNGSVKKLGDTFHATWLHQALQIGDEVRILPIETDEVDVPQTEKRAYPPAENDYDMRSRLLNVRAMLPASVQENANADLTLFDERLEQQNFVESMCILAELGEKNAVSAPYWRGLSWIAARLGLHDEAKQYIARENALPPQDENST